MLNLDLIFSGKIIAKVKPKKPQSLLKKYYDLWWKITKLIVKIYLKERLLKPYPTLNKIKHQKYKGLREIVKQWRLELNELKIELSNILK